MKLTDATNAAYLTKIKSKSLSGVIKFKSSLSKKNREVSHNSSANSSQPTSEHKNSKRRIRMKSTDSQSLSSSHKAKKQKKLRKSAVSPQTPNTLQEPSAKALPASSKVKINAKFNKLVQSEDKERSLTDKHRVPMISNTLSKKNLFQKKSVANPIVSSCLSPQDKSPGIRRASIKSNGSTIV